MANKRKTWKEKLLGRTEPEVALLEKPFGGAKAGSRMLIATPLIVQEYVRQVPHGEERSTAQMRNDLAKAHGAEISCPTSSSIFLRIVAEAAWEEHLAGKPIEELPPFWRLIPASSPMAKKLACGPEFLAAMRQAEGLAQ